MTVISAYVGLRYNWSMGEMSGYQLQEPAVGGSFDYFVFESVFTLLVWHRWTAGLVRSCTWSTMCRTRILRTWKTKYRNIRHLKQSFWPIEKELMSSLKLVHFACLVLSSFITSSLSLRIIIMLTRFIIYLVGMLIENWKSGFISLAAGFQIFLSFLSRKLHKSYQMSDKID